jgi:hypothetical protein
VGLEVLEFLVNSISPDGLVIGRNGDRDIPVGTTFSAIQHSRVHQKSDGYYTEELGEVGQIALTLSGAQFYQRNIDHVPRGHSAGLTVTGDGLELLAQLLCQLPRHEFLTLVAPDPNDTRLS